MGLPEWDLPCANGISVNSIGTQLRDTITADATVTGRRNDSAWVRKNDPPEAGRPHLPRETKISLSLSLGLATSADLYHQYTVVCTDV